MNFKKVTVFALFSLIAFYANAQQGKIGYTNTDYILGQMPEAKQIESDYKAYEKQLYNKLQLTAQGFQQEVEKFRQSAASMTEEARNNKQKELEQMQQGLQQDQSEAEASLQKKQLELFQPAFDKIQKAIEKVAADNGYAYVFSSDAGTMPILLVAPEQDNVSDLVLKQLGITPTTPAPAPASKPDNN